MPAAVDTNVLLPVMRGDADSAGVLVPFLDRFIGSVGLVISGPVYAELAAAPGVQVAALDHFLAAGAIAIELDLAARCLAPCGGVLPRLRRATPGEWSRLAPAHPGGLSHRRPR